MESSKSSIPFPFEPYPQQRQLMEAIFDTISASKSGCFESPTGTGKSLSVICSALHWQGIQEMKEKAEFLKAIDALKVKKGSKTNLGDDWLADMISSADGGDDKAKEKDLKQKERSLNNFEEMLTRASDLSMIDNTKVRRAESSHLQPSKSGYQASVFTKPTVNKGAIVRETGISEVTSPSLSQDDEFHLPHYDSDEAAASRKVKKKKKRKAGGEQEGFKASHYDYADKIHKQGKYADSSSESDEDDDIDEENELRLPQIFYCSRTHSQLAQFVAELRKTSFGTNVRCVTLGSRKNLCINPNVVKLGTDTRINDKCLDMLKSRSASEANKKADDNTKKQKVSVLSPCEFHKRDKEERFGDYSRGRLRDMEELVDLGRQLGACPYYATRSAVQTAQVVCMPYTLLLNADTRASMGLRLKGNVIIFDEAHNLVEAVNHSNSAEVSKSSLNIAAEAISKYLDRFQTLLTGKNLYYIQLLSSLTQKLKACLLRAERERARGASHSAESTNTANDTSGANTQSRSTTAMLMSVNDFTFHAKLDNVNLYKLRRYMKETNLIGRVGGYCEAAARRAAAAAAAAAVAAATSNARTATKTSTKARMWTFSENVGAADPTAPLDGPETPYSSALRGVFGLLNCLTNAEEDGRVVITCQDPSKEHTDASSGESVLRFLLLNPSAQFRTLANEARSVILLGGTLQPFEYLASSLFINTNSPPQNMRFFSCGHVVDRANVATLVVDSGPNGESLEFTHKSKFKKELVQNLLHSIAAITKVVPNGMVLFFTSYSYVDWLTAEWRRGGLLGALTRYKDIFIEPRGAAEAEIVWNEYSRAATRSHAGSKGAILLCVMGGKLSEGINFSNDLARAVVVVGMPFPDSRDPVLQEKLKQAERLEQRMNRLTSSASVPPSSTSSSASKKLYEAMCMNSVNQSIGRSIRHARDYAAIILIDCRYRQERVLAQLPIWIRNSLRDTSTIGMVAEILKEFYLGKANV